jgi:hypothetical protein
MFLIVSPASRGNFQLNRLAESLPSPFWLLSLVSIACREILTALSLNDASLRCVTVDRAATRTFRPTSLIAMELPAYCRLSMNPG